MIFLHVPIPIIITKKKFLTQNCCEKIGQHKKKICYGKKNCCGIKKNLSWGKKKFVGKKKICFGKKKAKKRMHYAWRTARQGRLRRPPTPAGVSGKARHRLTHGAPTHRRLGVPSLYAEAYIYI